MKLSKTLKFGSTVVPVGTILDFGNESFVMYHGTKISKSMIPSIAIERVSQQHDNAVTSATLQHAIKFDSDVLATMKGFVPGIDLTRSQNAFAV
jgi:hypothetical protein